MMKLPHHSPARALLLLLSCLGMSAPAWADAVADINAATAQWISAFNRKSSSDIVALYAQDAVFFGTTSPVLRDNPQLVREYFAGLPSQPDARITLGEHRVQVFGDIAISTGFYSRETVEGGKTVTSPARFSFAYARRNGRWLIVNHHSSVLP